MQIRDWLYVRDHCEAILAVLETGRVGEAYNIGGHNEYPNIEIVRRILEGLGKPDSLITYVTDRPGHDGVSTDSLSTFWRADSVDSSDRPRAELARASMRVPRCRARASAVQMHPQAASRPRCRPRIRA